jgi:multiple sugar transport system permease protein
MKHSDPRGHHVDLIKTNHWLGFWFMLPAMEVLIFFLAYPLGLGRISFTDAKIGRPGHYIGVRRYSGY